MLDTGIVEVVSFVVSAAIVLAAAALLVKQYVRGDLR